LLLSLASVRAEDGNPFRVEIDLQDQVALLLRGRGIVLQSPISSGRYGHLTQTGSFKVLEKEINHHSSIYGKIVDANGRTIVSDADVDMKVRKAANLFPHPCVTSCASMKLMVCTPVIFPDIRPRMGACACPNN
jgi:hypothetical protein